MYIFKWVGKYEEITGFGARAVSYSWFQADTGVISFKQEVNHKKFEVGQMSYGLARFLSPHEVSVYVFIEVMKGIYDTYIHKTEHNISSNQIHMFLM